MVFQFNQITLDTAQYRLCLSGNPISVEPQVFDLLIYLVENRDRVVTRDELLENLWKGKVVTDAALGVRLKDARKAVNDNGTKQKVIKTVHGRGYQFIAEVKESPTDVTLKKKEVLTTMDLLALSEKPSIAVLPFTNMSNDPEQEFFSDGIAEDIITELSRFAVLYVVARHSSFVFKSEKIDIKEVAEKLGVQYLVEGSVRRAGNRVRITAQLIEAKTGNHIWAERYDRELEDIFAVQDEVTQSIVAVLPGRVQENVAERASRKPTDNMKAYEFMLQAKSIRDSFNAVDTARARSLFEKAIELDPRYARAYMYLSDTYLVDILLGIEMADTSQKMVELTRKAVSLDSNEIAIQEQLGYVYIVEGLWENAELQFNKCLRKIVNEAEQMLWCGYGLMMIGRPEQAQQVVLEAMQLDPLHPSFFEWTLGQTYFFAQCYEDTIRVLMGEALLNSLAYGCLVGAYAHLDRVDEARTSLELFISERHKEFDSRNMVVEDNTIATLAGGYRKLWQRAAYWDNFADGLRKAGLPD